ncbi:LysR substrate-binding domain-containing protein [Denitrobaculum tricleocarpae]|uniref:LysR family transcriptional regulator n=1 Tax=Denitrobaculum tricleocarpae TaxID=2591009 RepID=A0A545U215_9PROT|nr:LysR substrate-binding domain-containing protein [Denitrobaculum tricleocarpae]TQV83520.1 LysR family transcriptional regulator [Denitrobaculum tricleocarpae]
MVSFRQLEYLVAVADHLHFRRASEACNVSQPALSAQIQQLEAGLGAQLLERSQRKVLLTAIGRDVVQRARGVLTEMELLKESVREQAAPLTGAMRLGVIPTVGPYVLPALLPRVRTEFPRMELYLREEKTADLVAHLRAGEIDLALLALPITGDDLQSYPLFDDPFVLAMPVGDPLVRRRRIKETEVAERPLLLLDDGHCLRDQALQICAAHGSSNVADFSATSLNTLVQMVANGLGVTLMPSLALEIELRADSGLAFRRFEDPQPSRQIGLLWRRSARRKTDFHAFAEMIGQQVSSGAVLGAKAF